MNMYAPLVTRLETYSIAVDATTRAYMFARQVVAVARNAR